MSPPAPSPASASAHVDQTETPRSSSLMEFGSTIMALANKVLDAAAHVSPPSTSAANCSIHSDAFQDCLNSQEFDDMGKCHYYVDMLADCCNNSTS